MPCLAQGKDSSWLLRAVKGAGQGGPEPRPYSPRGFALLRDEMGEPGFMI